jgi:hypothetical protein
MTVLLHGGRSEILPPKTIQSDIIANVSYGRRRNLNILAKSGALGLREVEAPTLLRQTANRWRQGCQPYAPAALYPQSSFLFLRFLVLISVRG